MIRAGLVAFGVAIASMVVNVAFAFAWVWVYSLLEPGRPEAFYEAYAQQISPLSSVIFGIPIWFVGGRLAAQWGCSRRVAWAAVATYIVLDVVIIALVGGFPAFLTVALASYVTKSAAACAGARTVKAAA